MDTKKSDHAYPKHRRCSPEKQSSEGVFPPLVTGEQNEKPKQASRRCLPAKADMPLDLGKDCCENEKGMTSFSAVLGHAHKDHTYLNSSQQKKSCAVPAPLGVQGMASSSARKMAKRRKTKKQNNRDTDHMYNTRRTESAETPTSEKPTRNTDHLYNLRKVEVPAETLIKRPNNRDTDHLYNLQTSKTQPQETRVETTGVSVGADAGRGARKGVGRGPADVDKRVVDKDHMYQHNSRKTRDRLDKGGRAAKRKLQPPENVVTAVTSRKKRSVLRVPESLKSSLTNQGRQKRSCSNAAYISRTDISATVSAASAVTVGSEISEQSVIEEAVYGDKVCSISLQREMVADPLSEHGHTTVQCKGTNVLQASSSSLLASSSTSTNKRIGPAQSDNGSDRMCEDDSSRSGVFHIDHMYVHADYLDNEGSEDSKVGLTGEGYKQEHSYAYSEEIRYDACKNCSQLVQQLIGTIRQQKDHIGDLKKQLQVAHAKNKLLSTMFSNQLEDVN
ncbi:uncharacterized protein [Littorina saxatilis]|uniref:Uncharacterized protein n=1 Tax=Littorina saxatilis TaxID=31220 RepID=A0AAN9GNV4_9CAEN